MEYVQRLFGTAEDGILYLASSVMKACKLKPGAKLRIIPQENGFRVQIDNPPPGGQP